LKKISFFATRTKTDRCTPRYNYFAQKADVEGLPDVASIFRATAEGNYNFFIPDLDK